MTSGVYAVVLAAGSATRFGSTKQLADIDGRPMVRHTVGLASRVAGERTLLVTGYDSTAVSRACTGLPGFVTVNGSFARGLGSSIAHAASLLAPLASAIMIVLADQPRVGEQHLRALVDTWSGDDDEIVATSHDSAQGPPVLFPRGCFADLAALDGDRGGRHLFGDPRFRVTLIPCAAAAFDVDVPADLTQI